MQDFKTEEARFTRINVLWVYYYYIRLIDIFFGFISDSLLFSEGYFYQIGIRKNRRDFIFSFV